MNKAFVSLIVCAFVTGCASYQGTPSKLPKSFGEQESGYTYIPIDPMPVKTIPGDSCSEGSSTVQGSLLESLPDNAVRMLIERFDTSGGVTYGASKAAAKNESYRVTVDYINADTVNVQVRISKEVKSAITGDLVKVDLFASSGDDVVADSEVYTITRVLPNDNTTPTTSDSIFNIPVYIGIGLRVSASIYIVGSSANISGIGVIGAEAEAERLRGSLVVQTLGVNGKAIAAALPIQSELNRTTAQNAIVSVGAIKALLYADETITFPRVVGLYLPFPGGKPLVNALISEISNTRVEWPKPCLRRKVAT